MKILYLYTELTPSVIAVIKQLTARYSAHVDVFYWEKGGHTPYQPPAVEGVTFIPSRRLSARQIKDQSVALNPDVIYISAWEDRRYLMAAREFVRLAKPVIAGFDDIWEGNLRQQIGSVLVRMIGRFFFTHAMVSGPRQYEYAKKFGFRDESILYHLFSADVDSFTGVDAANRRENYPRRFLFVGRFQELKALDILATGFRIYREKLGGPWALTCIGNGHLKHLIEGIEGLEVRGYMQHKDLLGLLRDVGAFVLASRNDPSPLVVHEFTTAGLPMILSENVGNRHLFLIDGFNGYRFRREDAEDLAAKMYKLSCQSDERLREMGLNSKRLSLQHNPQLVAASLVSVVI